jgi:hypothetical protein
MHAYFSDIGTVTPRVLRLVCQWLPIAAVIGLLGVAFGWSVATLLGLAVVVPVAILLIGKRLVHDPIKVAWPALYALIFAALGSAAGGAGLAILAGIFGLVIGLISLSPLSHRNGEPYRDGELARAGGLFFAAAGVALFVILVVATVAKAT